MELTLNNSFAELSVDEMLDVDGGIDWWSLAGGILAVMRKANYNFHRKETYL